VSGLRISIIVPCYNEEESLREAYRRVTDVLVSHGEADHELLFVDDGSTDDTPHILRELAERDKTVKVIRFSRNFGQQAAMSAGIEACTGDVAILMDADLQDPPELFPDMIAKYEDVNCNVVYAVRKRRDGESLFKKVTAKLWYRFINFASEVPQPIDTGDFRLIDRKVIEAFKEFNETNKYVRGLISWAGFRQCAVYYDRSSRFSGSTKYDLRSLSRLALLATFYFSRRPLQFASLLGVSSILVAFGLGAYALLADANAMGTAAGGWKATIAAVIFLGGVQLITVGILGQYLGRIFDEVKRRPQYVVAETLNIQAAEEKAPERGAPPRMRLVKHDREPFRDDGEKGWPETRRAHKRAG